VAPSPLSDAVTAAAPAIQSTDEKATLAEADVSSEIDAKLQSGATLVPEGAARDSEPALPQDRTAEASADAAGEIEVAPSPLAEAVTAAAPVIDIGKGDSETIISTNAPHSLESTKESDSGEVKIATSRANDSAASAPVAEAQKSEPVEIGSGEDKILETPAGSAGIVSSAAPSSIDLSRPQKKTASIEPSAMPVMSRRQKAAEFLASGPGADCFFARAAALSEDRPKLDGYAAEASSAVAFTDAFRKAVGVEPELSLHRLMAAQCPAIDFTRLLSRIRSDDLTIELAADTIATGENLNGNIGSQKQPYLRMLLVDDDGQVMDVTERLTRQPGGATFSAPVHAIKQAHMRHQIIVVLASDVPLDLPAELLPGQADTIFPILRRTVLAGRHRLQFGFGTFRVQRN
jgi:hypothetical protein